MVVVEGVEGVDVLGCCEGSGVPAARGEHVAFCDGDEGGRGLCGAGGEEVGVVEEAFGAVVVGGFPGSECGHLRRGEAHVGELGVGEVTRPGFVVDWVRCWIGVRDEEDEVDLGAFGGGEAFEERTDCVGYVLSCWARDGCDAEAEGRGGWRRRGRGGRGFRVGVCGVDEGESLRFADRGIGFVVAMGAGEEEG